MTGEKLLKDMQDELADDDKFFTDEELQELQQEMETRYGTLALPEAMDPRNRIRKVD